jgi:hypothetical protein
MIVCHLAHQGSKATRTQHAPISPRSLPIETGLPVAKWITGRIYTPLLYQGTKDIKPMIKSRGRSRSHLPFIIPLHLPLLNILSYQDKVFNNSLYIIF